MKKSQKLEQEKRQMKWKISHRMSLKTPIVMEKWSQITAIEVGIERKEKRECWKDDDNENISERKTEKRWQNIPSINENPNINDKKLVKSLTQKMHMMIFDVFKYKICVWCDLNDCVENKKRFLLFYKSYLERNLKILDTFTDDVFNSMVVKIVILTFPKKVWILISPITTAWVTDFFIQKESPFIT